MPVKNEAIRIDPSEKYEMDGPFECPFCHKFVSFDKKYLRETNSSPICPYCYLVLKVPL